MEPQAQRLADGHHEIALDERASDGDSVGHRERGSGERAAGIDRRRDGHNDRPAQLLPGPVVAPGFAEARGRWIVGVVHPLGVYRDRACADPG